MARANTVELTAREREVLRLLAWGNKEIALLMGVRPKTVKNFITSLNRKMLGERGAPGQRTRNMLLWTALRDGYLRLDEVSAGPVRDFSP